jgi:hypothetical protein
LLSIIKTNSSVICLYSLLLLLLLLLYLEEEEEVTDTCIVPLHCPGSLRSTLPMHILISLNHLLLLLLRLLLLLWQWRHNRGGLPR